MSDSKFYLCEKCGNTVGMTHGNNAPLICCGEAMTRIPSEKNCTLNIQRKENVIRISSSGKAEN